MPYPLHCQQACCPCSEGAGEREKTYGKGETDWKKSVKKTEDERKKGVVTIETIIRSLSS